MEKLGFKDFFDNVCYVVELRGGDHCQPFVMRFDAERYWDEKEKQGEEPKMRNTTISEIKNFLTTDAYEKFLIEFNKYRGRK